MEYEVIYLGPIIGRLFLISNINAFEQWGGVSTNLTNSSDYSSMEDFMEFGNENLIKYNKTESLIYYIYFALTTRVEIFKSPNRVILCDGFFFNLDLGNFKIHKIENATNFQYELDIVDDLIISDAANAGSEVNNKLGEGVYSCSFEKTNSYSIINLKNGLYSIRSIKISLKLESQIEIMDGIEISLKVS